MVRFILDVYVWIGKAGGRGALVISLSVNSPGAARIIFCRNKSYYDQHKAFSAQLASAFCHS